MRGGRARRPDAVPAEGNDVARYRKHGGGRPTGERLVLDPLGQYYASIIEFSPPSFPGNYTVSVHLKDAVDRHVLQQATADLFQRMPFLSGRLVKTRRGYEHELLHDPPPLVEDVVGAPFTDFYNEGAGHVVRVLHGERHFTVEVIHSIIDGRSTADLAAALAARYVELAGVRVPKTHLVDCADEPHPEEHEDAYARFSNDDPVDMRKTYRRADVYHHEGSRARVPDVTRLTFDLSTVKAGAKRHGATIAGYVLTHIFEAIACERDARGSRKPITATMAVDNRRFFPTRSHRNFISTATMVMPEVDDFADRVDGVRRQLARVDRGFVQDDINARAHPYRARYSRARMLAHVVRYAMAEHARYTTTFSNIGLITFPPEVAERVDFMDFTISQEGKPYSFGCISTDRVLTLTVTRGVEGDEIIDSIARRLGRQAVPS